MQKWPSYSEIAARLDINVNIVYQSTAMHGSSFSISSENPYKNEMTLWHVKEQIIKQDNTHHEPEGLHLSKKVCQKAHLLFWFAQHEHSLIGASP